MMDMASSTTSSAMSMMGTATSTAATATSTGMKMSMGGGKCKISMLWNWYTIDSCFLARSWHITSHGMFAGSCIGVVLLVMCLELLRRASREYDKYLSGRPTFSHLAGSPPASPAQNAPNKSCDHSSRSMNTLPMRRRGPTILQHLIRSFLHMVTFAVAYFVMLLAMYYNGYIIICIFIGAFLGFFTFGYERPEENKSK
ncbi:Ctr-domain-containing protein [Xylona heveae TC161]|uniref:Copper transport protein n=1 Tax=Xylona heveae (strain CBS 132557 / TC161) TaxID=1328760 RepID=A0A165GAQ1_XYLHT|nr:Ctr-domain-containing protein [Xylona heveae TC161]KZF21956.1 Ctr-domain-containing protein [Xylona heveae TC161]